MNQDPEVTVVLTVTELDTVMKCMGEQPFKIVHGIIAKLVNQANNGQLTPKAPTGKEEFVDAS